MRNVAKLNIRLHDVINVLYYEYWTDKQKYVYVNLIKVISSYKICSGIKSQQAKKPFVIHLLLTFDFFQYSSVPFDEVIFDHSISYVLLINKLNESCKKLKHLKEIPYPPKKAFKKKIKHYTSKDKCSSFTNFFRMPKISNSNLSNEKQKELKMKFGQLQEEISKASLPVSADLSNDFKSIIFETDQRKILPFMRLFWEQQQKYV